ncbi:MAG: hypothetical protein C0418_05650 [Coriobacteriaceae bacterium]|nr:hypothetical protein [Coriobacteriaceae bacterium]
MSDGVAETRGRGGGRLRVVLIVVIVLLLAGMAVLGVFFVRILQPPGMPDTQGAQGGLVWVRSIYGFGPAADEQLLNPTSVAIAPNGDIYVNDAQRARIMRFNSSGAFKSLLHTGRGGTGEGQFIRPESIAVDADSNVYIADSFADKIIVYNDQGGFVREWGTSRPTGVTVRGERVFVLTNGLLTVFNRNGENLGSFGRRGRNRGDIDAYQGVTGDDERIYVADALNQRLQAFDQKGNVLWVSPDVKPAEIVRSRVGTTGDPEATPEPGTPYDLPQDLVFDGAGRLVVIDAFKFKLIVVSPKDGAVLASYGESGSRDGTFFYPTGVDYDPVRDWFAVADTRNNRVQIVRLPESGDSGQATVRRLLTSPYRYCAPPVLLALIAIIVAVVTRRRARADEVSPDSIDDA